jgi:predicted transcriptional regulator
LYICEVKFSKNPIPASVIDESKQKIARLSMPRHMSYQPVLIHAGALADTVAEQEYFSATIDFGELLNASAPS